MENKALIIFAKNPLLGRVKTRLASVIGDAKALEIYNQLLKSVHIYSEKIPEQKIVYWEGGVPSLHPFLGDGYRHELQPEGDLGEKMSFAFEAELKSYRSICIIGTDCLELTPESIKDAFKVLECHDVVIGPAVDGGYYLLGMNQYYPFLFQEMKWSSSSVFDDTILKVEAHHLNYKNLPMLSDVDTYQDYQLMLLKGYLS